MKPTNRRGKASVKSLEAEEVTVLTSKKHTWAFTEDFQNVGAQVAEHPLSKDCKCPAGLSKSEPVAKSQTEAAVRKFAKSALEAS
jgi:hypothetical protein